MEFDAPSRPRDQYEAIVDRLGAMADRDDRKAVAPSEVEQFVVFALRGFGLRRITWGAWTYGSEMESCIRTQVRSERAVAGIPNSEFLLRTG